MQLVKDIFFVSADKNALKTLNIGGVDFHIDTDFTPFDYSTRIGVVTHTPLIIDSKYSYDNKILDNDVVIFHHFVCQPQNEIKVNDIEYFKANYFHIFAKVEDNDIICVEDFIFVEPIKKEYSERFIGGIQFDYDENSVVQQKGIIRYLSKKAIAFGLNKGDIVYFTKNADYKMEVLGNEYYRMRIRNVVCVERDGNLVCMNDRVLLEELEIEEDFIKTKKRESIGKVIGSNISDINVGDVVGFFSGVMQPIDYKGKKYLLTKKDNINYIQ